jgi:hypothetical protein
MPEEHGTIGIDGSDDTGILASFELRDMPHRSPVEPADGNEVEQVINAPYPFFAIALAITGPTPFKDASGIRRSKGVFSFSDITLYNTTRTRVMRSSNG